MNRLIDLTGRRFERLLVITRAANNDNFNRVRWLCKCDCGKEVIALGTNLKRGDVKSCGCIRIPDLVGKKFGRLTVIKNVERPKNHNNTYAYWECLCDCGTIITLSSTSLKSTNTRSCGCWKTELFREMAKRVNRIGFGEAAFNRVYQDYKREARRRKLEFDLSKEYFKSLVMQNCYYCGADPVRTIKTASDNGNFICNGIDRVNNSLGYVKGNVVSSCTYCNFAKHNKSIQDFLNWVDRIYNHSIKLHKVIS